MEMWVSERFVPHHHMLRHIKLPFFSERLLHFSHNQVRLISPIRPFPRVVITEAGATGKPGFTFSDMVTLLGITQSLRLHTSDQHSNYCNTAAEGRWSRKRRGGVVRESRRGCYGWGRLPFTNWAGAYYSRG
jgi:hypothetical protein